MSYNPGLHILAQLKTSESGPLSDPVSFKHLIDSIIAELELQKVGEVYHTFDDGGFTCVVCLTESHLSIHTWPAFKLATFDVFLSSFRRNNDDRTRLLFGSVCDFLNAEVENKQEIAR